MSHFLSDDYYYYDAPSYSYGSASTWSQRSRQPKPPRPMLWRGARCYAGRFAIDRRLRIRKAAKK